MLNLERLVFRFIFRYHRGSKADPLRTTLLCLLDLAYSSTKNLNFDRAVGGRNRRPGVLLQLETNVPQRAMVRSLVLNEHTRKQICDCWAGRK
jgi:hypothetical protein